MTNVILYFTITWNGEKENFSYAYKFFTSHCGKFISTFTALWNIKGKLENRKISKLNSQCFHYRTWHLELESQFSYFFIFLKRSLDYI